MGETGDRLRKPQWPPVETETLPWHKDPDDLQMISKTARRRIASTYDAAVPLLIAERDVALSPELSARIDDLLVRLSRFDAIQMQRGYDLPALMLRSESSASSQIEHLTSSVRSVALADVSPGAPKNAQLIAGNVAAMRIALGSSDGISLAGVLAVHRALMEPAGESFAGRLREEQVWVGGTAYSPHGADYVAPCAERVPGYLEDIVAYAQRTNVNPIVKAAVVHAQFETVHPFIDGNGRTGRALIHKVLKSEFILGHATIPISAGLLHGIDGYLDALVRYRQGDPVAIVEQLVDALDLALIVGDRVDRRIDAVLEGWRDRMVERKTAAIYRLPAVLVEQPVVDVTYLAHHLGITDRAARSLVLRAVEYGMLQPMGNRRRGEFYQSDELLDVLEQASRVTEIRRMVSSG